MLCRESRKRQMIKNTRPGEVAETITRSLNWLGFYSEQDTYLNNNRDYS